VLYHDHVAGGPASNALINFTAIAWSLCGPNLARAHAAAAYQPPIVAGKSPALLNN
jgi:hypothetical protein